MYDGTDSIELGGVTNLGYVIAACGLLQMRRPLEGSPHPSDWFGGGDVCRAGVSGRRAGYLLAPGFAEAFA